MLTVDNECKCQILSLIYPYTSVYLSDTQIYPTLKKSIIIAIVCSRAQARDIAFKVASCPGNVCPELTSTTLPFYN